MASAHSQHNMTAQSPLPDQPIDHDAFDLQRQHKVLLVMDLVESVRLMATNEARLVPLWASFMQRASHEILPRHQGRLVKSLGDGLLAEFDRPSRAVAAALELQRGFDAINAVCPPEERLLLRAGLNAAPLFVDHNDVYGHGVNVAARVASLAQPGETLVTDSVRDGMVDRLDADLTDLGLRYVKHLSEPLRVYRVGPPQPGMPASHNSDVALPIKPTVAVLPFQCRVATMAHPYAVGNLIVDAVIGHLSRLDALRVVSALSSMALNEHPAPLQAAGQHLGAHYVLNGSHVGHPLHPDQLTFTAQLHRTDTQELIWSDRFAGSLGDLLSPQSESGLRIAEGVGQALLRQSAQQALSRPLPTLPSHTMLLAGIQLMHRSSAADFDTSRRVLSALVERHPRAALSRAWLAKWYVLNTTRGWSEGNDADTTEAWDLTQRALDAEPGHPLAMAMQGFVQLHLKRDTDTALRQLTQAVELHPSDALSWLFKSVAHAFDGAPALAVQASDTALALSPLDPLRYYYESLAASSHLCAGQLDRAIALCESSLRQNRHHPSTWRAYIAALHAAGEGARAREAALCLLEIAPQTTVRAYLERSAGAQTALGERVASGMAAAGIPQQ